MLTKRTQCFICRGSESMVQQAKEWESSGEYARAVECYLKVTSELSNDKDLLCKCWMKVKLLIVIVFHIIH